MLDIKKAKLLNYNIKPIKENLFDFSNFSHPKKLYESVEELKPKTIIEVGTFVGYSAIKMAKYDFVEKVYVVDTWEFNWHGQCKNPQKQFLSNVIHNNLTDKIIPYKGKSVDVGVNFWKNGYKSDFIYIDANHKYINALADIVTWFYVGDFICGDDYVAPPHQGVINAVDLCAKIFNKKVNNEGKFWWYE